MSGFCAKADNVADKDFVGNSTGFTDITDLPPIAEHRLAAEVALKISGEQTIQTSGALHKTLAEYLDRGLPLVLDLSEVDECDAAALQLIYALRQSAVQREQPFRIQAASPAITETAAALGLRIEDLTAACEPAVVNDAGEMEGSNRGI
jgi:anti-anti-sigma regulatory factor